MHLIVQKFNELVDVDDQNINNDSIKENDSEHIELNDEEKYLKKLVEIVLVNPSKNIVLKSYLKDLPLGTVRSCILQDCAEKLNTPKTVDYSLIILKYKTDQDVDMILKEESLD